MGTSSFVSKITPLPQKNWRITVYVFLPTLQLTALLLKSFRLRLHCYTLAVRDVVDIRNRSTVRLQCIAVCCSVLQCVAVGPPQRTLRWAT